MFLWTENIYVDQLLQPTSLIITLTIPALRIGTDMDNRQQTVNEDLSKYIIGWLLFWLSSKWQSSDVWFLGLRSGSTGTAVRSSQQSCPSLFPCCACPGLLGAQSSIMPESPENTNVHVVIELHRAFPIVCCIWFLRHHQPRQAVWVSRLFVVSFRER